jgi:hypothetical protein
VSDVAYPDAIDEDGDVVASALAAYGVIVSVDSTTGEVAIDY